MPISSKSVRGRLVFIGQGHDKPTRTSKSCVLSRKRRGRSNIVPSKVNAVGWLFGQRHDVCSLISESRYTTNALIEEHSCKPAVNPEQELGETLTFPPYNCNGCFEMELSGRSGQSGPEDGFEREDFSGRCMRLQKTKRLSYSVPSF
jgi:hypothetical protein